LTHGLVLVSDSQKPLEFGAVNSGVTHLDKAP